MQQQKKLEQIGDSNIKLADETRLLSLSHYQYCNELQLIMTTSTLERSEYMGPLVATISNFGSSSLAGAIKSAS